MISNKGFNEKSITLYIEEGANVGEPVTISAANTAKASAEGDNFAGILINQRNGCGAVQVEGYASVTYTGTAPALGRTNVCANGSGGIKTGTTGRTVLVLNVNEENSTAEIIM